MKTGNQGTDSNLHKSSGEVETFESLKAKLESLIAQRNELNKKILEIAMNPTNENKSQESNEELDALDQFMMENEQKIKAQSKEELISTLREINTQIQE